jgi:hypothetical protein
MKKIFFLLFVIQAAFIACNDSSDASDSYNAFLNNWEPLKRYQTNCSSIKDAIKYPDSWTFEVAETFIIPDETVLSMSTCGLLKTWMDYPERVLGPWCTLCSNSKIPGVTRFNDILQTDKVTVELFKRGDCASVLASKYLSCIKANKERDGLQASFEMLLASDMCMAVLNKDEKILFMAMALEKMGNKNDHIETRHIMVAIMRTCNYTPFLNDVKTKWDENIGGYDICYNDMIEKYAKQFLDEHKL